MNKISALKEVQEQLSRAEITVSEVVDYFLNQIAAQNQKINAFVEVYDKEAKTQAKTGNLK